MSIKVGIGLGAWPFAHHGPESFWRFAERCESLGIDSLWFIDRLIGNGPYLDPLTLMASMAARTRTIKFGPSVLALSLRNPVLLAKEIATIDYLSGGRIIPAVGLGADIEGEAEAAGINPQERGRRTDEAIQVMRRLWTDDTVTFEGRYFQLHDVRLQPKPVQKPCPPVWIGGRSEAALKRLARLGDGWLAASITPIEIASGLTVLEGYLDESDRSIDTGHIGVIMACCVARNKTEAMERAGDHLFRRRPDVAVDEYNAIGNTQDSVSLARRYIEAGVSKFILRLACPPELVDEQLDIIAREIIPEIESS